MQTEDIEVRSNEPLEVSAVFVTRPGTFDKGIIGETWQGLFYTRKFSVKPGDIVVDIGAHIGAFSVYALKKGALVYSFEPEHDNFMLLSENMKRNGAPEEKPENYMPSVVPGLSARAVTGDGRDVKFIPCSEEKNTGGGWTERQEGNAEEGVIVPSCTLDEIAEGLDRIDFLKMDCEGAEYEILMQSSQSTIAKIQKIAMEWHGGREAFDQLRDFLKQSGFKEEWNGDDNMGNAYFWRDGAIVE